jgi:2-oxo-4-hydroxy-4-carboxy-5-ureidoimidazoline decarboxylase
MAELKRGVPAAEWLDALPAALAADTLARCCGSSRWVHGMLERRPYGSNVALHEAARAVWAELGRADYLEAFAGHPPIGGDFADLRAKFSQTFDWSKHEQAKVADANETTLLELKAANRAYLERFGFIFIICASGQTATEMLSTLHRRLGNDPLVELKIAAAEQAKITALRLEKVGA